MDWKNKHFSSSAEFPSSPEVVLRSVRAFVKESLPGWQVSEVGDGLEIRGWSGAHAATATFSISPDSAGAVLTINLAVERKGPSGFMLFDVGGYYNGQIRKWLIGVQGNLNGEPGTW